MGLSLNNLFQRPYINPDAQGSMRRRTEEEKSSASTQKESNQNQNERSNGLNYVEQKKPTYTPAYEQKFNLPAQNAYSNVNIHSAYTPSAAQSYIQNKNEAQTVTPTPTATATAQTVNNKINIAQILKDFRNTSLAIGTPEDLDEIVTGYLNIVEKQVKTGTTNPKVVKSTLNSAASILDNYISETLNKDSKVVEKWVDALFLQNIDLEYNEESINERFLVQFPSDTPTTKRQEEISAESKEETIAQSPDNTNIIPISVATETSSVKIPEDKLLKSLFIQAKKYTYANDPEKAIRSFEQALNRALEIDDTETSGKIYYEVGKIYDDHDFVVQALKSYNQSLKLTTDENVKTKAHYSMAQIYDDVNQIKPAMDHYFSTVSHAGEAENLPAQSASLTKIGNIYTDMYEKEAFDYYDIANDIANETDNFNLKGFVASNTGKAYTKFDDPKQALASFTSAVKNYTQAEAPLKTAQNYVAAADVMVEYNNLGKAVNLLKKAQNYARKTDNVNLMNEINTKLEQLKKLQA